jgi:hypothetical protein
MREVPKRRWFKFSLRTLLVAVAIFPCWLAYEVHWIHQRHRVLTSGRFTTESPAGAPVAVQAPGLLWLFGEPGYESIWFTVPKGEVRDDMELSPSEKAEFERVSRLFPEAEPGEWWEYGPIVPAPPPATTVRESEHNPVDELDPFRRGPFKGGTDLIR